MKIIKRVQDYFGNSGRKLTFVFGTLLLITVLVTNGCAQTPKIAPFDPEAYSQDIAIRNYTLDLMDYGIQTYTDHQTEVEVLQTTIEKAYQAELKRNNNDITIQMWAILKSPGQDLLGGFLKRWRDEGTLSVEYIQAKKGDPNLEGTINWTFEKIIKWEQCKQSGTNKEEREALLKELQLWLTTKGVNPNLQTTSGN